MVKEKEKRKTRLDKGGGGGGGLAVGGVGFGSPGAAFIGFGAFSQNNDSNSSTSPAPTATVTTVSPGGDATATSATLQLSWSPVYTGSDSDLQMIFTRIRSKKDATTKCKALQQLQAYFEHFEQPAEHAEHASSKNKSNSKRRSMVEAARHWIWLYHNALHYDTAPSVKAQALLVWKSLIARGSTVIPKALYTLLHDNDAIVLGMIYTAANADAECKTQLTKQEHQDLLQTLDDDTTTTTTTTTTTNNYDFDWNWQQGILTYTRRILSFGGRPMAMHQALFAMKKKSTTTTSNSNYKSTSSSSSSNRKQQQQQQQQSQPPQQADDNTSLLLLSEAQQDLLQERFEKITGNTLDALATWLPSWQCTLFFHNSCSCYSNNNTDNNTDNGDNNDNDNNDLATFWLKTLTSPKASLRRRTFHLVAVWATTTTLTQRLTAATSASSSSTCSRQQQQQQSPTTTRLPLLLPDNIHARLSQAMVVEKEAFNWPALLEAVLAVTTCTAATTATATDAANKTSATATTTTTTTTTSTAIVAASLDICYMKPLSKALKRALHGASVAAWGPMLLPICALVDDDNTDSGVLSLLQAAWSGRTLTCGMADQWLLFQAVAEVCVYSLVRPTTTASATTSTTTTTATTTIVLESTGLSAAGASSSSAARQGIAALWLETLQEALQVDPTTLLGKSRTMHEQLVRELARQLRRLEQVAVTMTTTDNNYNTNRNNNASSSGGVLAQSTELQTWFWTHLDFSKSHAAALASLVSNLPTPPPPKSSCRDNDAPTNTTTSTSSPLDQKWRDCFTRELQKYQQSSGQVPVSSSYQLWTSLVQHVGPKRLFDYSNNGKNSTKEDSSRRPPSSSSISCFTLERFVMNDLLRWMVIHTSTLSQGQHEQSKALVEYDFGLLKACFNHSDHNDANATANTAAATTTSMQSSLWEPLLREIVKAQCDIDWLVAGLYVLLAPSSTAPRSSTSSISSSDWIPCPTLDELAIRVGHEAMDDCIAALVPLHHEHLHHEHGGDDDDNNESTSHSIESTLASPEEYERRLHFLQTCVGLFPGMRLKKRLVGDTVIEAWVAMAYESLVPPLSTRISPLLEVLLSMVSVKDKVPVLILAQQQESQQQQQQVEQILLGSWKYCAPHLYTDVLLPRFSNSNNVSDDSILCARFVTQASERLQEELSSSLLLTTDQTLLSSKAVVWADRAWRIIQACPTSNSDASGIVAKPSLALFGLSDSGLWKTQTRCMFLTTMCLLKRIESHTDRFRLTRAFLDSDETELVLSILLTLSDAGHDVLETAEVCNGKDRAARFLSALGGFHLKRDDVERWIRALVSKMAESLAIPNNEQTVQKSVAVLSLLINVLFSRIGPGLSPNEIKAGDRLWYIADSNNPRVRETTTIVKSHYDSQAGYYFSIRLNRDGDDSASQTERQTVVTRLRREQVDGSSSSRTVAVEDISNAQWAERKKICDLFTSKLILPFFSESTWQTCIAEVINIIVSQLGLSSDRGIGSAHYNLFKMLSNQDDLLCQALDKQDYTLSEVCLWQLSLALGFGLNTASTSWSLQVLSLDPIPSYQNVLKLYRGTQDSAIGLEIGSRPKLDHAVVAWLCVSIPATEWTAESQEVLVRTLTLLFELASDSLKEFTGAAMVGVRAIYSGLVRVLARPPEFQSVDGGSDDLEALSGAQSEAVGQLIRAFAVTWSADSGDAQTSDKSGYYLPGDVPPEPAWRATSSFSNIVEMAHADAGIQELFRSSIRSDTMEGLSKALLDEPRRFFAFELLGLAAAQRTRPHREAGDVVLGKRTLENLKIWKQGLELGEASELEQDVEVVSQWLPLHMMESVEAWKNQGFDNDELTPQLTIGRFLTWLSVLRFIDAAAPIDFCNRPAFVSYLTHAEAVGAVLNTALLFEESVNVVKGQPPAAPMIHVSTLVEHESNFTLSNLSSVVLFRTIEVLPSLSRRFWEEYCPKVYVFPLQSFLEQYIAPEILRLELERINKASSFGEMNVSGSLVSREVTANVIQDDFTLSVLIRLPTSFPLRSAEVDCSKTFGVPPTRWKRWSLQIKLMLNNQGGTLKDALLLWKENVNQEFEGVEPCPVCYSVLHVKTHKLPTLECLTCKNRFHVDCLTQWFKSSGKSQCVLCQQDWKGTRV